MTRPRKQRIDSTAAAVEVMLKSTRSLDPPSHAPLYPGAEPFWSEIIAARARSEWNDHDLTYASDLANAMLVLVENRDALRNEGPVIVNANGNPTTNPLVAVVHGLHAQIKSARQSLSIHGRSAGEPREVIKRRAQAKEIEAGNPLEGNDLLARPDVIN